ncbi:UNVERIFIED_ORG: DNA/RNA endonuclease G (NUC1) [Arthrobacter globiformis]|nr:DNA/RNA endonuclease G (NUC1) [Arthrobacter globiformis]
MGELLLPQTATVEALSGRHGFDENFLGQPVRLPALAGAETALLPYTPFSVLMRSDMRLAAVTGVGIGGEKLMDLDRAAPQAAKFNQGTELWLGIKRYLQEHAAQYRSRVVVFPGLIFVALDPVYRARTSRCASSRSPPSTSPSWFFLVVVAISGVACSSLMSSALQVAAHST